MNFVGNRVRVYMKYAGRLWDGFPADFEAYVLADPGMAEGMWVFSVQREGVATTLAIDPRGGELLGMVLVRRELDVGRSKLQERVRATHVGDGREVLRGRKLK